MKTKEPKHPRLRTLALGLLWGVALYAAIWVLFKVRPDLFLD